jgi:hypothetical protein
MDTVCKCTVDGCNRDALSNGGRHNSRPDAITTKYCRKHLSWLEKYGSTDRHRYSRGTVEERFWKFVDKSSGCWSWNGSKNAKGYGLMQGTPIAGKTHGKTVLAHRVSYEIHHGTLDDGDYVMHLCDNPQCTNPDHLRKGTQSENIKDAITKGRKFVPAASGIDNPRSKLTEEQVRFIKAHPELGHKAIGDMFGLSPNCIRGVRIGRTWTHIN